MSQARIHPAPNADLLDHARRLRANIERVVYGKTEVVELALTALFARGHLLLEDAPGVGKTTLALALAKSIDGAFRRIQFTNDTLPSDILGVSVYSRQRDAFHFTPGPIFASVVLADEINRASPKTQSALLEAMSDRRVSYENDVHPLPEPFFVVATQNPLEHHGVFPLPENQLDRFLARTRMGYPAPADEREILLRHVDARAVDELRPVMDVGAVLAVQDAVERVAMDVGLLDYIVGLAGRTRAHPRLELGVSPRGSLALKRAAQALAFLRGRAFVVPEDVQALVLPVLAHRVSVRGLGQTAAARREAELALREIVESVPVPL